MVLDAKLMERFPENESDVKSGTPVNFDEPHEWLAMLSSSDQLMGQQHNATQQTPRMTPKKAVRSNVANTEQLSGKTSPSRLARDENTFLPVSFSHTANCISVVSN